MRCNFLWLKWGLWHTWLLSQNMSYDCFDSFLTCNLTPLNRASNKCTDTEKKSRVLKSSDFREKSPCFYSHGQCFAHNTWQTRPNSLIFSAYSFQTMHRMVVEWTESKIFRMSDIWTEGLFSHGRSLNTMLYINAAKSAKII